MTDPALLGPDAAAAWLGCSRSAMYRLVRDGRLVAVRPFRELRFRVADLEAFIAGLTPANRPAPASAAHNETAGPGRDSGPAAPREGSSNARRSTV
jgi:excisionase family DNA binding protein